MRLSAAEKYEIIQTVTSSEIGMKRTLKSFGIARSSFYKWYQSNLEYSYDGLETTKRTSTRQWNSIPERQKDLVVQVALNTPNCLQGNWPTKLPMSKVFLFQNPVFTVF